MCSSRIIEKQSVQHRRAWPRLGRSCFSNPVMRHLESGVDTLRSSRDAHRMNDDHTLDEHGATGKYPVYRHPSETAHFGPEIEPWLIYAHDDEEAIVNLKNDAKSPLGSAGHGPDDLITLNRPDGTLIRHWKLGELAR